MAAVVTAEFFIKPELIDEALTLLAELLPDTRGFKGCKMLETVIDLDDPGHVMVVDAGRHGTLTSLTSRGGWTRDRPTDWST